MPAKERSLQVLQDPAFQHRQWRIQRVGWAVMAILLLAALAGVFGKGPLSHAQTRNDSLDVEYERFVHALAPTTLKVTLRGPSTDSQVRIAINRDYVDAVGLERISPQPVRVEAVKDDLIFEFAAPNVDSLRATFEGSPAQLGTPEARISLAGAAGAPVRFTQLIYP